MSEYIERKTTVAKIIEQINQSGKYTDYECGMDDACYIISHIPAADVRPVTTCDSCVWRVDIGYHYCNMWCAPCPDNAEFFCAYGERPNWMQLPTPPKEET